MRSKVVSLLQLKLRLRRRRSTLCWTLALTVVITLCFLVLAHANTADQTKQRRNDINDAFQRRPDSHSGDDSVPPSVPRLADQEPVPLEAPIIYEHENQEPVHAETPIIYEHEVQDAETWRKHDDDSIVLEEKSEVPAAGVTGTTFVVAFRDTMALMPSAMSMRSLLAPFRETGEAHLQDLAARVRVFRTSFEAWEELHQAPTKGMISYQNVVQHLRSARVFSQDIATFIQRYDAFRSYLNQLAARLFPGVGQYFGDLMAMHASFYKTGRGIVFTMGDHQVNYVLTSIRSFRKLGCALPIEIMYLGDDDLGDQERKLLEALPGVVTRDMSRMIDDEGWKVAGWAAKPWAILMSSFQEVLFMDADVLFFVDPEVLFNDPQYQHTGALFFKDRNLGREMKRKWIRSVLPKPISEQVTRNNRLWTGESGHMQDSGVLLIDKWRHFVPLLVTARLNGIDRDGNEEAGKRGVYDMVYGDKETFWLSWEMAGVPDYAFHDGSTGIMGTLQEDEVYQPLSSAETAEDEQISEAWDRVLYQPSEPSGPEHFTVCSPQLLHFDKAGNPLWLNGWLSQNKFERAEDIDLDAFEVFIEEPTKDPKSRNEPWELKEANTCCLTAQSYTAISDEDKEVLSMIVSQAKENDWDSFE